jgi:hypothetical protein
MEERKIKSAIEETIGKISGRPFTNEMATDVRFAENTARERRYKRIIYTRIERRLIIL